eukprot:3068560-Pleurochrysis_carterae.AAC.1
MAPWLDDEHHEYAWPQTDLQKRMRKPPCDFTRPVKTLQLQKCIPAYPRALNAPFNAQKQTRTRTNRRTNARSHGRSDVGACERTHAPMAYAQFCSDWRMHSQTQALASSSTRRGAQGHEDFETVRGQRSWLREIGEETKSCLRGA